MPIFDGNLPYTNLHELNNDWIVKTVKEVKDKTDEIDASVEEAKTYSENAKTSEENALDYKNIAEGYKNDTENLYQNTLDTIQPLNTRISQNESDINIQTARIDSIISGTTPDANAELIDIRIAYDGETYPTAGDSVRAQAQGLSDILTSITEEKLSKNRYDGTYTAGGFILPTDGNVYANVSYDYTDYIDLTTNDTNSIIITTTANINNLAFRYALYDSTKTYVSGAGPIPATLDPTYNVYYAVIALNGNEKYMRFSRATGLFASLTAGTATLMISYGSTVEQYEPYYAPYYQVKNSALEFKTEILDSMTYGKTPAQVKQSTFINGQSLIIEQNSIMKNEDIHFFAKLGSFDGVYLGHGQSTYGFYIKVDTTNISYISNGAIGTILPHNLTISGFIDIIFRIDHLLNLTVIITTASGQFEKTSQINMSTKGDIFAASDNSTLTDVTLTWNSDDYKKAIWCFGDSYLTLYSPTRWTYYVNNVWGYDTMLLNGFPGCTASDGYNDLLSALNHGTPRYLLWTIGMNNPDTINAPNSDWVAKVELIKTICENKGIELILCTIPAVTNPAVNNTFKNQYVRASGYRYVDFANAVAGVSGWLSDDGVHPSEIGGRLLAGAVISDCPELIQDNG